MGKEDSAYGALSINFREGIDGRLNNTELAKRMSFLPMALDLEVDLKGKVLPRGTRKIAYTSSAGITTPQIAKTVAELWLKRLNLQKAIVLQYGSEEEIRDKINPAAYVTPGDIDARRGVVSYKWIDGAVLGDDDRNVLQVALREEIATADIMRNKLIENNLDLVKFRVRRKRRWNLQEELIGVGNVALTEATFRYDWRRGYEFSTFASSVVDSALGHYMRDDELSVHPPRNIYIAISRVNNAITTLINSGESPTIANIATTAKVDVGLVTEVLVFLDTAYSPQSVNVTVSRTNDTPIIEKLAHGGPPADQDIALLDIRKEALIKILPDARLRTIIEDTFFQELTQTEIAAKLGISQMHVSRLLKKALDQMRDVLDDTKKPQPEQNVDRSDALSPARHAATGHGTSEGRNNSPARRKIERELTPKGDSIRRFIPGKIPTNDQEGILYLREMVLNSIAMPEVSAGYQSIISIIPSQLRDEGFPVQTIARVVAVASAFLASEKSLPISMILSSAQTIIDDARELLARGIDGDVISMAMHHPASYYFEKRGRAK